MSETNSSELKVEDFIPSPTDVEREMISGELKKQKEQDPAEAAALMFHSYLPRYFSLVDRMSSNAMRRLLKALIEVPLNSAPYHHSSQEEKDCFAMGDALLQAKVMLIYTTAFENEGMREVTDPNYVPELPETQPVNEGNESNG